MLTLQFIPYYEIENLTSSKRISKLLDIVKSNKIVLLEGKLKKEEETQLIRRTMEEIDDSFSGIELQVIEPPLDSPSGISRVKKSFINMLLGDRIGMTIIGPANIIKEIKHDPEKIQLLTAELKAAKKRPIRSRKKIPKH